VQEEVSTFISFGHILCGVVPVAKNTRLMIYSLMENKIGSVSQSKLITNLNVDTL